MSSDRLIYLPLGGAGEIGMNAYVYGYGPKGRERLLLVDLGVAFPYMDSAPGVDLVLPDIAWLEERRDRLEGILVTHAHEDHVGAVGHLWPKLGVPVHARAFTAHIARTKMEENGLDGRNVRTVGPYPERHELGPFAISMLPVSHSIPESSAVVIDTPAGRILHTGDFKIDSSPVVGEPFDDAVWTEVAKPGARALVCDSTNVFSPREGRSESSIGREIGKLVAGTKGMVVATTFASNVARLKTLAEAGREAGRSICLFGRAMRRMVTAAQETGVLTGFPATVSPEDAAEIPRESLMLLATGSQGERRAASAQLSRGKHLGIQLKEGDLFLFSSKTIPGNERDVTRIVNAFSEMGVDVVDDSSDRYHVSGHANRPDLATLHGLVAPRMVIPMHGEHRHLRAHAGLAAENGLSSIVAPNGAMIDLSGDEPKEVERVETGRVYVDGSTHVGDRDGVVRDRIRMALNGHVLVTAILDGDEPLGEPWCDAKGLPECGASDRPLVDVLEDALEKLMQGAGRRVLRDDEKLDHELRRCVRNACAKEIGKKPEVTVAISRLE